MREWAERLRTHGYVALAFDSFTGCLAYRCRSATIGCRSKDASDRLASLGPMSFVSHVECTICSARHDAKRLLTVCE